MSKSLGNPFSNKNFKISDSARVRGKLVIFIPSYFCKLFLSLGETLDASLDSLMGDKVELLELDFPYL